MKKQCLLDREKIISTLTAMQPLCNKRTTIDATAHILFQISNRELVLKATDLEISLQASCPLQECTFDESVSLLVQGRRIFEIVKELEGPIECAFENNQLELRAQSVHVQLNVQSADDFPRFPERIENLMGIERARLLDLLRRVIFLIPQNNSNPALNGLFVELSAQGLSMTSTDGHCLVQVQTSDYPSEQPRSWLLPRRAVFELKKLLETVPDAMVFVGVCEGQLVFSGELFNFFTRLIAQPFPEYRAILQQEGFLPGSIDRSLLTKSLRRSASLLSGQFVATRFTFSPTSVRIALNNKGVGALDETIPLKSFSGTALDIRFYAPYLLDGLQIFDEQDVLFHVKNETSPLMLVSQTPQLALTFLVMPVSPVAG